MRTDLHATRLALIAGDTDARTEIERSIGAAESPACESVFLRPMFDGARREAAASTLHQPLAGLAFSAKDLFDIDGQPTPAGSVVLANAPVAGADATAVARLRAAGGALLGRTNMTEFAFSGVGVNPHHGTPANAADAKTPRIPGGSSSGAAISVATGAAFIGLGSDTGGSIRIPAALNGIVGFKSTARLVPADGALPLSTTLDTVCAMTRSVRDAITAHEILAARTVVTRNKKLGSYRLAIVKDTFFDGIEPAVSQAFERALVALKAAGAKIEEIALPALADLSTINATGGFSAAEAYAWHRQLLERSVDEDPCNIGTELLHPVLQVEGLPVATPLGLGLGQRVLRRVDRHVRLLLVNGGRRGIGVDLVASQLRIDNSDLRVAHGDRILGHPARKFRSGSQ